MPVNPNWNRWVYASVIKHFKDLIADLKPSIYFFIEGEDRVTAEKLEYVEFRMNGPIYKESTSDEWRLDICINILVSTKHNEFDFYSHPTNKGIVASSFTESIEVYKFGNEVGDTQELFGCLVLYRLGNKTIQTEEIGQVSCEILILQAALEGCYKMDIIKES